MALLLGKKNDKRQVKKRAPRERVKRGGLWLENNRMKVSERHSLYSLLSTTFTHSHTYRCPFESICMLQFQVPQKYALPCSPHTYMTYVYAIGHIHSDTLLHAFVLKCTDIIFWLLDSLYKTNFGANYMQRKDHFIKKVWNFNTCIKTNHR